MDKKLAVTGNRIQGLNEVMKYDDLGDINYLNYIDAMSVTVLEYIQNDFNYFICGGALGVDLDFAEYILYLKEYHGLHYLYLEIAVPCLNQDLKWNIKDKKRYKDVLKKADKITYISKDYSARCMFERNIYMVNKADAVVAFWNGKKGGTSFTIEYAKKTGKDVEIIDLHKL